MAVCLGSLPILYIKIYISGAIKSDRDHWLIKVASVHNQGITRCLFDQNGKIVDVYKISGHSGEKSLKDKQPAPIFSTPAHPIMDFYFWFQKSIDMDYLFHLKKPYKSHFMIISNLN